MVKHIAVYGTLRRGGPANGLLRGCKYLGLDRVPGSLYDMGAFPALRLDREGNKKGVLVDLYEVPEGQGIIIRVDKYEGYYPDADDQSLFVRKETVTLEGALPVTVYEYKWPPVAPYIPSGDWLEWKRKKP